MGNMDIYERARSVPEEAKKPFNNGKFKGTDINPMWRIKKLTELFGPCGIGWYVDDVTERREESGDDIMVFVTLKLYIRDGEGWSKPIYGTGGNSVKKGNGGGGDEAYKMAYTDALSVACKALGVGADVYFERDRTKYTASEETPKNSPASPQTQQLITPYQVREIKMLCSDEQLGLLLKKYGITQLCDMTFATAKTTIDKLKERAKNAGTN